MAYETIGTITRYTWLSTDTKPTGCNDGSTGFERNTGKNYVYSTISGWGLAAMPVVPFDSSGTEIVPATAALQTTGNTSLSTIAGKDFATQTTLAAMLAALSGGLISSLTSQAVTANTNIITTYTATANKSSQLMIMTNTAGILSLLVDSVSGTLNNGDSLDTGTWYAFEIPIINTSTYNLQFSVNATMQIKWVVR